MKTAVTIGVSVVLLGIQLSADEFTVTTTDDTLGTGSDPISLRDAIWLANTVPGPDTIHLPPGYYALSLQGTSEDSNAAGDLDILESVTLLGDSARTTILDANGLDRILDVRYYVTCLVSRVTIRNGYSPDDNGSGEAEDGGGIRNVGHLVLEDSIISSNRTGRGAPSGFAGGEGGNGGCIYYSGDLNLTLWLLVENNTGVGGVGTDFGGRGGSGGGIYSRGPLVIDNSTITMNKTGKGGNGRDPGTGGFGGGLYVGWDQSLLTSCTIVDNTTGGSGHGGGVFIWGNEQQYIGNSVIAHNQSFASGPDVSGTVYSLGYNLIKNTSQATINGTSTGNLLGVAPRLLHLLDAGGNSPVLLPQPDSPLLDAGNPSWGSAPGAIDQRGVSRSWNGRTDIGAAEFNGLVDVTTTNDSLIADDRQTSLREAVIGANNHPVALTIFVPDGLYRFSITGQNELDSLSGDLNILESLTILGQCATSTIIDAQEKDRIFHVEPDKALRLYRLTLRKGHSPDGTDNPIGSGGNAWPGGAIFAEQASVYMEDCIVISNRCGVGGSGINGGTGGSGGAFYGESITLLRSTLRNNQAGTGGIGSGRSGNGGDGGAIYCAGGMAIVSNSAIYYNRAGHGAPSQENIPAGNGGHGGGISLYGSLLADNSTISGNSAGSGGYGLGGNAGGKGGNGGGLCIWEHPTGTAASHSCTIARNHAGPGGIGTPDGFGGSGGGAWVDNREVLQCRLTTISDNTAPLTAPDIKGEIYSEGWNHVEDLTGGFIFGITTGNQTGNAPVLSGLSDYGGPTLSHLPLPGSPLIDAGPPSGQPFFDQRYAQRPWDGDSTDGAALDIGAIEFRAFADRDADGLSDEFEQRYYGSITNATADDDDDQDGLSNRDEFIADTNPLDENDLLRILSVSHSNGFTVIHWQGGTESYQYLERTTNLTGATPWQTVTWYLPPCPPTTNRVEYSRSRNRAFYRIRAVRRRDF